MNRIISRKRVATVYALEVHRKGLSVDAVTGVSASNCQEHTEKLDAVNIVHQYDIAIVGGGMVGMALACALSRKPLTKHLNVAIIDNNPALEKGKNIKKGAVPDPRVSTVTPATISFFKVGGPVTFGELGVVVVLGEEALVVVAHVGAWDYVQQHRHTYFDKMQVQQRDSGVGFGGDWRNTGHFPGGGQEHRLMCPLDHRGPRHLPRGYDIRDWVANRDNGRWEMDNFIDWLNRVDKMLAFKNCNGQRAMTLVKTKLMGYALNWWENIQQLQVSGEYDYVTDWEVMRGDMMVQFIPSTYEEESFAKLQTLRYVRNQSVDDYASDFYMLLSRVVLSESKAQRVSRFRLGLTKRIQDEILFSPQSLSEILEMARQVWDYTGLGYTRYTASDICKDILGCVVENKVLHSSLLSSLLVGADGGKSRVRELAALKTTGWKYSQNAIICTVEHTVENKCAWQRFLPTGPIALLPIGDNFSNIVWTMNPKESSDRKIMVEDEFVKAINHALDYGYGPHPQPSFFGYNRNSSWELPPKVMKVVTERMVFPLSLMYANDYVANRVALVGDAAHIVHPLAGQGVNLGIADALALVKVIADGIAVGSDIGDLGLLKRYEAERKPANIIMTAILDSIQKGYSVDLGPLNLLRAAAFHATEHIFPLKRNIISYATGEQKWPLFSEFN
ncbi:hypothetical protein GIB67_006533 [Kingdonia uniflora]|uniref:Ubiquinone biosynthesis monooxygenase COQ6, mitochondrial n=1 Tax=Kingdonia uniflora TaxID=39325 RepID=A0A7J7LEU5_9MAGN|nr:hypothetical protein GIB67_006533 [Kingdonia uniflora]